MKLSHLLVLAALSPLAGCNTSTTEATLPLEDETLKWANVGKQCDDASPAVLLSQPRRDSLPADILGPVGTPNRDWADLARTAPGGIGGLYQVGPNSTGNYYIWLTDPSKRSQAIAAIKARFPDIGLGFPLDRVQPIKGRWDFAQLGDWYGYFFVKGGVAGITAADIQEANNRLEFGVPNEDARATAEQWLAALDVPCRLVAIYIQPPIGFADRQ